MPGNGKTYLVYLIQGFSSGKSTERSYVGVLEVPAGCWGADLDELIEQKRTEHTAAFVKDMNKNETYETKIEILKPKNIESKELAFAWEFCHLIMTARCSRPSLSALFLFCF